MGFFRGKVFATMLWLIFFGIVSYYFYNRIVPCAQPIHYKVGMLDQRFGVSTTTFLADIAQAESLWDDAAGKKLFVYDPNGSLPISLVYDDRQAITQQENVLNSSIDADTEVAQSVKDQYTSLHSSYTNQQASYNNALSIYNQKQSQYNSQVQYWNSRGGAPEDEYKALQTQKAELATERAALDNQRQNLISLGSQINALIDKYNLIAAHINDNVDAINNDGLAGTQFEEGVYISDKSGTRVNIYQFDNKTAFIRVLAHELGHSLGLEHNNGVDSIMNPINKGTTIALSTEDISALKILCKIK